jgi:hypothetical protein
MAREGCRAREQETRLCQGGVVAHLIASRRTTSAGGLTSARVEGTGGTLARLVGAHRAVRPLAANDALLNTSHDRQRRVLVRATGTWKRGCGSLRAVIAGGASQKWVHITCQATDAETETHGADMWIILPPLIIQEAGLSMSSCAASCYPICYPICCPICYPICYPMCLLPYLPYHRDALHVCITMIGQRGPR